MNTAKPLLHCAPMTLSESQKKYLRGLGHALKPVVMIGDAGLTEGVRAEFESSLEHHELIKVRVKAVSYTHLTLPTIILPCRSRWGAED